MVKGMKCILVGEVVNWRHAFLVPSYTPLFYFLTTKK